MFLLLPPSTTQPLGSLFSRRIRSLANRWRLTRPLLMALGYLGCRAYDVPVSHSCSPYTPAPRWCSSALALYVPKSSLASLPQDCTHTSSFALVHDPLVRLKELPWRSGFYLCIVVLKLGIASAL
ncbi:hypothetical protein MSAN_01806200 [Mycena sanguinolenta]|uniref:Uncharacterized protein n=1 Tax=Mycena sanguinolenta TaxID=230812 RepID=A0A8H6XUI6_9AGAR|nr:hypothetical protein MSAN_01806200 [Mycena sanguinolenta]